MTKTTMPEPVAWRSRYKNEPGMIGQYPWSYVEHSLRQPALNNYDIEALITTAQAEAYANARVREALEKAAAAVEQHDKEGREWVRGSLWDAVTREAASRIRALIPKEPPCEP